MDNVLQSTHANFRAGVDNFGQPRNNIIKLHEVEVEILYGLRTVGRGLQCLQGPTAIEMEGGATVVDKVGGNEAGERGGPEEGAKQ